MSKVIVKKASFNRYPNMELNNEFEKSLKKIYELVSGCLIDFGCDVENFNKKNWNPMVNWIKPGDKVFILPNFVMHRRSGESVNQFFSKCTHSSIIIPIIDFAIRATKDPSLVTIGNSPLQSCDYDILLSEIGFNSVQEYFEKKGLKINVADLRLYKSKLNKLGVRTQNELIDDETKFKSFNLGTNSFLESHYNYSNPKYRVGDYDYRITESFHSKGRHEYVINQKIVDADVIISVPKLKVHQKVGITCALKGTVGTIGRKECLAHHRKGGPSENGDEYMVKSKFFSIASNFYEHVDSNKFGFGMISDSIRLLSKIYGKILKQIPKYGILGGGWEGNDTAWRMALDIARVLRYGDKMGSLSDNPQRKHIAFIDGIIGGQGQGPLRTNPKQSNLIIFGDDICLVDTVACYGMGIDPNKIPLVYNSFKKNIKYPLTDRSMKNIEIIFNGKSISYNKLFEYNLPSYLLPKGWSKKVLLKK